MTKNRSRKQRMESYSLDIGWHLLEEWLEKPRPLATVFESLTYPDPVVQWRLMEAFGMWIGRASGRIL